MKKVYLIIFLEISSFGLLTEIVNGQTWSPIGTGLGSNVYCLQNDTVNNLLYAGGNFITASANHITKLNGTTWDSLGSGINSIVYALAVYNGELYAGGSFTTAGSIPANFISKWNGTAWDSVSSGMNSDVRALAVYNGELYAGGNFSTAGGISASCISKWNGTTWDSVGTGISSTSVIRALTVYNGELYAGGWFTTAGGSSANNIAKWNGTSWTALGTGTNNPVYSLAVYNGELYVGGNFTIAGGNPTSCIAKWDGATWSVSGGGFTSASPKVYALAVYNGELYAGGLFTTAGGSSANNIAKWNGTSWSALGTGTNNPVYSLAVYNGALYVGGAFFTAGGLTVNNIAKWTICSPFSVSITPSGATTFCQGDSVILTASVNDSYLWSNGATTQSISVSSSGNYSVTATDANGCADSSSATTVIVNPTFSISDPVVVICDGDSTLIYGTYKTAGGTYYDSLTTVDGCDSIHSTVLTTNPTYGISDPTVIICTGDSALIYGTYRITAGIYYDSFTALNGCDSVHSTILTVNSTYSINTPDETICNGDSVMIFVVYCKIAGTYYDSSTTVNGCDSITVTTLIVNPTYSINTPDETICDGDSVLIFGVYRKTAETYYNSLTTVNDCDSIISTTLIINPLPTVSFSGLDTGYCSNTAAVTLIGTPTSGTFSGTGINGNQFDPAAAGIGTYTITYSYTDSNACTDSESKNVNVNNCTGIENFEFINGFEIYPNPNTGEFNIEINITRTENLELKITNNLGQIIFTETLNQFKGNFKKQLNLNKYPAGIYNFHLVTDKGIITRQIIIE